MKRRYAIPLALIWLNVLVAVDLWCIVEFKVADAHLNSALSELFEAPVSFGELSIGPTLDVVLTDVRMMRPDAPEKIYGTIDEIRITPRWPELLTEFRLDVKDIAVTNPTVVIKWKNDRTFDMPSPLRSDLEARTKTMGELPAIKLDGLTLVLDHPPDLMKKTRHVQVFDQLSVTLAPEGSARWLYRFDVDVDHPILGHIFGGGKFSKDAFEVHLKHRGLSVSTELVDALKPELAAILGDWEVDGELTLSAEIAPVRGGTAEALTAALECEGVNVRSRKWELGLSAIRGKVLFEDGVIKSTGVIATFEGAQVVARGKVDLTGASRVVEIDGQAVGLPVTNSLAARIRKLPEPCPTVADQIEAWDPDGFADVEFRLEQQREANGGLGTLHPSIDVEFKGGSKLRYIGHVGEDGQRHGFAYPLHDLRGMLRFTDKAVVFERLTAMNGSLAVEARGRIDYEHSGDETYDVDVDAHGLRLDAQVSAALQGASRELFNSLDADGSADLTVAVKRQKGEPPGPRVDIAVELQGVALNPKPFPVDFADARGRVVIPDSGPIRIEKVTAKRGGGSLSLVGSVPVRRGQSALEIHVQCVKFPVDAALTGALRAVAPDAAEVLAKLNPTGGVDGTLHVASAVDGSLSDMNGAFQFEDMTLAPEDPSLRVEDLDGSVAVTPSRITINQGTTASIAGERFAIRGTVTEGSTLDLWIEAENFQVDRELLAEVEPLMPWIRSSNARPAIEGPMSIKLHVGGQPSSPEISFDLDCLGVDVVMGSVPGLRFDDVKGHCSMTGAGVATFRDLTTRIPMPPEEPQVLGPSEVATGVIERPRPPISVEVTTGTWTPAPRKDPSGHGRLALGACSIRGAELSPSLISLLPLGADVKQKLVDLVPAGKVDLSVSKLTWDGAEVVTGRSKLTASGVSFGTERTLRMESATIDRLIVKVGDGGLDLNGDFVFRDARFLDIPLPAMVGKITSDGIFMRLQSVEADLFAYENREGRRFALGKLNPEISYFSIRLGDGSFDTKLRFQEVNLPAAIRVFGGDPGRVAGVFNAAVDLNGTMGDSGTYVGSGDVAATARNVVSIPVFYKMFNSLDVLSVFEKSDPRTKIEVDFRVANSVVEMPRMKIDSPDVPLQGKGRLTFGGVINADLKARQGMGISPIGWVTRLISHVVFAGVRIDGPIGDPRVNAYSITGG